MELLPEHRHLLDWTFEELGEGPIVDRQYWIACMEPALQVFGRKRGTEEWKTYQHVVEGIQNAVDYIKPRIGH